MTNSLKAMIRLAVILAGLMLFVAGCSQDEVTGPEIDQAFTAEDPLDDVLKSTDGQTPADPEDRCNRLAEVLGLDEDQLAALSEAYTTFRDGIADLRTQVQAGDITKEEACAAAADLREAFEAELQIILTEEQWALLQEMRDGGPRGGDNGDDGDNEHQHQDPNGLWLEWLAEIGVDEGQITAIFEALEVFHTGMQDLREQVRDGSLTREEACEAAAVLRADLDAALQTILTPEQYQALLDLRPDCEGPRRR